ncbi:MAG: glycosyl hydrolase, partial [Sphingomonas sp.]
GCAQSPRRPPCPVLEGDPKLDRDAHPMGNYDIEGAAIGYKWFDKTGRKPLFPFGYGLSYTQFALDGLKAEAKGKGIAATFAVRNTGSVAGKTVAQVYVAAPGWEAPKRLGAFQKVDLSPGASQSVATMIDPRLLATFDTATATWKIAEGDYQVMLADSAASIAQTVTVHLPAQTLDSRGK